MTKEWAEGIAAGYEATKLLRGAYQVEHVHVEEALPDNFVVVVYLVGYPEPCVLGDAAGTQAWLDARGLKCDEAEIRTLFSGPDADSVAERLLGSAPIRFEGPARRTYWREEPYL